MFTQEIFDMLKRYEENKAAAKAMKDAHGGVAGPRNPLPLDYYDRCNENIAIAKAVTEAMVEVAAKKYWTNKVKVRPAPQLVIDDSPDDSLVNLSL